MKIDKRKIMMQLPNNSILYKVWFDEFIIPNTYVRGMDGLVKHGNNLCTEWLAKDSYGEDETVIQE